MNFMTYEFVQYCSILLITVQYSYYIHFTFELID